MMVKKLLSIVLVMILTLNTFVVAVAATGEPDVEHEHVVSSLSTASDTAAISNGDASTPAAPGANSTASDAGSAASDAGSAASDAGSAASDAGSAASDAGSAASDAGNAASDAGNAASDAGSAAASNVSTDVPDNTDSGDSAPASCSHAGKFVKESYPVNTSYQQVDANNHSYQYQEKTVYGCADCGATWEEVGTEVLSKTENHFLTAGVCDLCGYKVTCSHPEEYQKTETITIPGEITIVTSNSHTKVNYIQTQIVCEACGSLIKVTDLTETSQEEPHSFVNSVCSVCQYCVHNYGEPTTTIEKITFTDRTENTHTYTYFEVTTKICTQCGTTTTESTPKTATEDHEFADGKCAVCGYGCTHDFGDEEITQEDHLYPIDGVTQTEHQHTYTEVRTKTCKNCNYQEKTRTSKDERQSHQFVDFGYCELCGYRCEHVYEEGNSVCTNCGCECLHNTNVQEDQEENGYVSRDGQGHVIAYLATVKEICEDCGTVVSTQEYTTESDEIEPHTWKDGVCSACGYACFHHYVNGVCQNCQMVNPCQHGAYYTAVMPTDPECSNPAKTGHTITYKQLSQKRCLYCNEVMEESVADKAVSKVVPHFLVDGRCLDCGYQVTCSHVHVSVTDITLGENYEKVDENSHKVTYTSAKWYDCLDCGESWIEDVDSVTKEKVEPHNYTGGKCDMCGAVNTCKHNPDHVVEEVIPSVRLLTGTTAQYHTILTYYDSQIICDDCGELLYYNGYHSSKTENVAHTFQNGKCSVCGYLQPAPEPVPEPAPEPETEPVTQPTVPAATEPEETQEPEFVEAAPDTEVHGVKVSDNVTLTEVSVAIAKSIEEAETPVKAQVRKLDQILTVQEVNRMDQVPAKEKMFAFLTVMGFEEAVNKSLDASNETLSDYTVKLISDIKTRVENMTAKEKSEFDEMMQELFPITTQIIDGKEYQWFQFEMEIEIDGKIVIERYGFRLEDGEWIFSKLETAELKED